MLVPGCRTLRRFLRSALPVSFLNWTCASYADLAPDTAFRSKPCVGASFETLACATSVAVNLDWRPARTSTTASPPSFNAAMADLSLLTSASMAVMP